MLVAVESVLVYVFVACEFVVESAAAVDGNSVAKEKKCETYMN